MSLLILVVDEPDVEVRFRQHFRRDLCACDFTNDVLLTESGERL